MVSASRKKALNPFLLVGIRLLSKIGSHLISVSRKISLSFKKLILSNFNNGFHQQKQKL